MHCQPDLYSPSLARQHHRQPALFDANAAEAGDCGLACDECNAFLVRTDSHLCCPNGHGRLIEEIAADDGDSSGLCFPDDLPEPPPDFPAATMRAHARRLKKGA